MTKRLTIALSDEAFRRLCSYCEMAGVSKGGCIGMLICQNLPPANIETESPRTTTTEADGGQTESAKVALGNHQPIYLDEYIIGGDD